MLKFINKPMIRTEWCIDVMDIIFEVKEFLITMS